MPKSAADSRRERRQFGIFSKHCLPILEFLIGKNFSDEIDRTDVTEELKLHYGSGRAYGALESLRRAHLVKFKKVKASSLRDELAKKKRRIYELTLNGLVYVLAKRPDNWKKIDEVARKQPELFPPIFGNWSSFSRFGVKKYIVSALSRAFTKRCLLITTDYVHLKKKNAKEYSRLSDAEEKELRNLTRENEAELEISLSLEFFSELLMDDLYRPPYRRIIAAFRSSPELRTWMKKVVKYSKLNYSARIAFANALQRAVTERGPPRYKKARQLLYDADKARDNVWWLTKV